MSIRRLFVFGFGSGLVCLLCFGLSSRGRAQDTGGDRRKVEVGRALYELSSEINASIRVSPRVNGFVTLGKKETTFETAIQDMLRQVNATYYVYGGVYFVVPKGDAGRTEFRQELPLSVPRPDPSATAITQDGKFVYILSDGVLFKLQKSDMKLVKTGLLSQPIRTEQ